MGDETNPDSVKDALEFARKLALEEIKSIDRLHKRTLAYIAAFITVFSIIAGALGFVGYNNLKEMAIAVAQRNLQQEVTRQVEVKLKKEDINSIVQQQVKDFSANQLTGTVKQQIQSGPLHQEILAQASSQSKQILVDTFGQRHLSEANAKILISALNREPLLKNVELYIEASFVSTESYRYQKELRAAISKSHVNLLEENFSGGSWATEVLDGVSIIYDKSISAPVVQALQRALREANIYAPLVQAPFQEFGSPQGVQKIHPHPIELLVGPKPLPAK